MKNKNILILTVVLSTFLLGMSPLKRSEDNVSIEPSIDVVESITIVSADSVLMNPSQYKGLIAVEGKVATVDESNSTFGLGCDDGCLVLPVKCSEKLPEKNSSVTVYGEVKKIEGKGYVFESKKVVVK